MSPGAPCDLQVQELRCWLVGTTPGFRRRNVDTVTALMGKRHPPTGTVQVSPAHLVSKDSEIPIKLEGRAEHSPAALGKGAPTPPCCRRRGRCSSTLRGCMAERSAGHSMGRGASLRQRFGDHAVHVGHVGGVAALEQGEVRSCSSQLTHLRLPVWGCGAELCVPLGISVMLALALLTLVCVIPRGWRSNMLGHA